MGSFSIWHWLIVLLVVVLIFGTKKLRNIGSDLGGAVKGFKDGMKSGDDKPGEAKAEIPPSTGMSGALDALRSGQAALARLPRLLTEPERASGLRQVVIAREPVVFATGSLVSLSNLSRVQLAAVFAGRHADWAELGCSIAPRVKRCCASFAPAWRNLRRCSSVPMGEC